MESQNISLNHKNPSRALDQMADVVGAKRLLIMWVPKSAKRAWMTFPWGFCIGRLWIQVSPKASRKL